MQAAGHVYVFFPSLPLSPEPFLQLSSLTRSPWALPPWPCSLPLLDTPGHHTLLLPPAGLLLFHRPCLPWEDPLPFTRPSGKQCLLLPGRLPYPRYSTLCCINHRTHPCAPRQPIWTGSSRSLGLCTPQQRTAGCRGQ